MEILWKGTVSAQFRAIFPKLRGKCAFPQNFQTMKLDEITVLYTLNDPSISIRAISPSLHMYFSYISIVLFNSFLKAWGDAKASFPSIYEILQFRFLAPLKLVLTHCIVIIVILYYMQNWKFYIIKRIYCLFVRLSVRQQIKTG